MCWSPSLQKSCECFWTKPLEKVGKKDVVHIPMEWIQSHVLFLTHFQHKLHQKTKFGSKSKSSKKHHMRIWLMKIMTCSSMVHH